MTPAKLATVTDVPFARSDMAPGDDLPGALATIGLTPDDLDEVVLAHMHGDHMNGAVHLNRPVLVQDAELAYARSTIFPRRATRLANRVVHDRL